MDKLLEQSLLYDFYGELLTEHQRTVYEGYMFDDMSLGEIAKEQGISRQGVHDLVKRCDKTLLEYEEKLHLVKRFSEAKNRLVEIRLMLDSEQGNGLSPDSVQRLRQLTADLLEDL